MEVKGVDHLEIAKHSYVHFLMFENLLVNMEKDLCLDASCQAMEVEKQKQAGDNMSPTAYTPPHLYTPLYTSTYLHTPHIVPPHTPLHTPHTPTHILHSLIHLHKPHTPLQYLPRNLCLVM